ncbi:hypothetical protein [Rhodanobacter sp. DHG33]|uniref:hypothetical protein n=1 Tax=Rhodanobacter sp. DHG33 TaxID=2775921 RepID=UPI001783C052|nr:hypothetical protein [Rhodanobacter sp. DHG33]MBD8898416.1 hypothetical protein [Rhodanobacter sp. DHG33]
MNAKLSTHNPAAATSDVFATTLVPARRWIASAAAVVMTSLTLAAVTLPTTHAAPVAWINGIHVTNLAPVEVTPSSADMKAASMLENAAVGIANGAGAQIGAQLAMPYYSFGTTTSTSSKE